MPEINSTEQFHIDQLKGLREEIIEHIRYLRQLELYAVAGTFILWGWLKVHPDARRTVKFAWVLPFLLVLLGFLKHRSTQKAIGGLGAYIQRAEQRLEFRGLGWENSTERCETANSYSHFNWLFWCLLAAISLCVGLFLALTS